MKLSLDQFATQDTAESGVWFEPSDDRGRKLGIELLVYGDDADIMKVKRQESLRAQSKLSAEERSSMDFIAQLRDLDSFRVGGIRIKGKTEAESEIELAGRKITKDRDDIKFLFLKSPSTQDGVRAFSQGRANFLPVEKETSNKPSDASSSSTIPTGGKTETIES